MAYFMTVVTMELILVRSPTSYFGVSNIRACMKYSSSTIVEVCLTSPIGLISIRIITFGISRGALARSSIILKLAWIMVKGSSPLWGNSWFIGVLPCSTHVGAILLNQFWKSTHPFQHLLSDLKCPHS